MLLTKSIQYDFKHHRHVMTLLEYDGKNVLRKTYAVRPPFNLVKLTRSHRSIGITHKEMINFLQDANTLTLEGSAA